MWGFFRFYPAGFEKAIRRKNSRTSLKSAFLAESPTDYLLRQTKKDVQLYHRSLLQILEQARKSDDLRAYHFALLRQVLENVASFLGKGQFGYVLDQIGIDDPNNAADIINTLSHKKVYYYETDLLVPDRRAMLENVLTKLQSKYKFALHA